MKTFGSEFQSFRLRIIFGCIILLFLAIVCVIWKISAEYRASVSSTQAQTNDQVLAIEVFMLNAIDRMNAPLNAVAAAISQRSTEVSFTPADVKSLLTSPLLPSTADYWFVFINAEVIAIAASNDLPILGVSFSDREYYLAQKSKRREGLLIGDPNFGRASGIRIFSITRRVDDAQGNFMGIIVAVVDLIPLVKILGQFSKDNSQTITVASSSRKIIAQIPNFEESFSKDFSNSSLFTHTAQSSSGTYREFSPNEKKSWIYSYRVVEKYPLVISVGMPHPNLLDMVLDHAYEIIFALLTVLLVLIFGSRFAIKRYRAMEDFALSQLQLNRQLDNAQDLIELASRRSRMIADNMPALVAYIDAGQRYQFLNSQYLYTHGIDHEKMIGSTILEVFGPVYYAAIEKEVERALNGETLVFERETSCSGDKSLCLRYQYSPDINQDGVVMGFYSLVSDVTDMKAVQTQLLALSKIDALTGLPNRTALRERLDDAMARVFRRNHGTAKTELIGCLFLDIDSFKLINDSYGHICGDEVLKEFASRLEVCIRKTDMVARLAGDEFVILLEKLENSEDAVLVANKIINMMSAPFVSENCQLFVTVSIGITVGSDMNETTDSFLKKADDKLYIAKKNGKNTYAI